MPDAAGGGVAREQCPSYCVWVAARWNVPDMNLPIGGNRISQTLTLDANTTALAWFSTPTAYRTARRLMTDGWQWPPNHGKWLENAERTVNRLEAAGRMVVLIDLDPTMFRAWCRAHGQGRD